MSIIYIFSTILLITLAILIEKSKEKIEITKTFIIVNTLLLAYNGLVCYILNLVNIPITLISLAFVNLLISTVMLVKIIKSKKIQKYTISRTNIIVVLIFIIIVGIIININFEGINKIRYVSMDAREHYKAAREFSENMFLSNKSTENNTVTGNFMPMAYTNVGICFKILNPYIGTIDLYKVYILFEAFAYLLVGLMFYILVESYIKSINGKIIAIIFGIIYMLGYPLNAWISGFHYLLLGILFVELIIYINNGKRNLKFDYDLLILFLTNFGLILSYSLFCPFVYLAEFIYYCYQYTKDKSGIKLFLITLVTLILPGIIGVTYLILPSLGQVSSFIALEGWLYKNMWSNFILFIPFTIYALYKSIKNKEFTFDNLIFILLLAYMLLLCIGVKIEKCSEYYCYKNYFVLWILLIYLNIKGILQFMQERKGKYAVNIYMIIYLIILGTSIYYNKTYVRQEANDNLNETMEIFTFNNTMIHAKNAAFLTSEELKLYKGMEIIIQDDWKDYENEILFITSATQERWIQSLTGYKNILYEDREYAIENLKNNNYKYIVISKNRDAYENLKQYINKENLEMIYDTNEGEIYIKKGE